MLLFLYQRNSAYSSLLTIGLSQVSAKAVKLKPLSTPAYARAAHYIRCNCLVGVPSESRRYEAVSVRVMVGDIRIQTYAEIVDPSERTKYLAAIEAKNTPAQKKLLLERRNVKFAENIPHILSFLPIGLCSQAPKVNTYWNFGTNLYTRYIDMRNCVPWMVRISCLDYSSLHSTLLNLFYTTFGNCLFSPVRLIERTRIKSTL